MQCIDAIYPECHQIFHLFHYNVLCLVICNDFITVVNIIRLAASPKVFRINHISSIESVLQFFIIKPGSAVIITT